MPQGNFLFSGIIRDEALRGTVNCSVDDSIRKLPQGSDTERSERGDGLLEGQMQRIAIDCAIYSECPTLIFDEANGAFDQGTETSSKSVFYDRSHRYIGYTSHGRS